MKMLLNAVDVCLHVAHLVRHLREACLALSVRVSLVLLSGGGCLGLLKQKPLLGCQCLRRQSTR